MEVSSFSEVSQAHDGNIVEHEGEGADDSFDDQDEDSDDEYERMVYGYDSEDNDEDIEVDIKRIEAFKLPAADQSSSKLFTEFPGEVRDLIYECALSDFEDMNNEYDDSTCYKRPEYLAPRKTDTAILRTCQAVYNEAWFLPWTQARHTFYLAASDRKPRKTTTVPEIRRMAAMIERLHPDMPARRKEFQQIQVFAQAYALEPGHSLAQILGVPNLMPKVVTITLRHTDIWDWESDDPVSLGADFVNRVMFPASVTCVEMQFESVERRKLQIDEMARQATKSWFFKRSDGVHLTAKSTSVILWTGCSTWNDERWVGDEDEALPGRLSYYMATVAFCPAHQIDDAAGYVHRSSLGSEFEKIEMPHEIAGQNRRPNEGAFQTDYLEGLGVTEFTPASKIFQLVSDDMANQDAEHYHEEEEEVEEDEEIGENEEPEKMEQG